MLTQGKDDTIVALSNNFLYFIFFVSYLILNSQRLLCPDRSTLHFYNLYNFSTCVCTEDKVETFPVLKIDAKDIVDTNGAGDAFVGGKIFFLQFDTFLGCLLSVLCFLRTPVQLFPPWCRLFVEAGPGETTGSVCGSGTLRRQRHHQTNRLHLPGKT